MDFPQTAPTLTDFDNCDWECVVDSADDQECRAYRHLFAAKAGDLQEAGDEKARVVFVLLHAATSLHLKDPANDTSPFCPMLVDIDGRTPDVDDFTDEQLDVFNQLISRVKDSELRARIADIVWTRKRGHQIAGQAVDAYLESARRLEDTGNPWPLCIDRISRAVTLATLHGRNTQMYSQVMSHVKDMLDRQKDDYSSLLPAELMKILLDHRQGDCNAYAKLSGKFAAFAEKEEAWSRARAYWDIQAAWLGRAEDEESSREARIRSANTHVQEAEARIGQEPPDFLVAALYIQSAIEAFRRIGGETARIENLHRDLLNYQRKGAKQFGIVSAEAPIHEMHSLAVKAVEGKSFQEAMFALGKLHKPSKLENLRQQVERNRQEFPLQHLFPRIQVDSSGRTTGHASSAFSIGPESEEDPLRPYLLVHARTPQSIAAVGLIEPARLQILRDHFVRVEDLLPLVANNPFVPEGREGLYAHGLHAGLEGNFVVATHILVPQIENSIRHALTQHGAITSSLDSEGIQDVHLLGKMLFSPEIKEIFGEDLTFELQGLLMEPFGANLRNTVAHGLISHEGLFSPDAIYLWWLTLHLLCRIALVRDSQTH